MLYPHFEMLRRQGQCFINLRVSQMAFISKNGLGTLDYGQKRMNRIVMICCKRGLRFGENDESHYSLGILLLCSSSKEYSGKIRRGGEAVPYGATPKHTDGLLFLLF